jgi:hypothetical protein
MPSPPIPLEALLELRALLDSLQSPEIECQRMSQVHDSASMESTAPLSSKVSARRRSPQTQKATDDFQFFQ